MLGREVDVQETLRMMKFVGVEKTHMYLFYRLERPLRWLCAVAKRLNGEGFLITAYPTDAIKEGEQIWVK